MADTVTRAAVIADRLHELRDDVEADFSALDRLIAAYHAAEGDPAAQATAERKVSALMRAILNDLVAVTRRGA